MKTNLCFGLITVSFLYFSGPCHSLSSLPQPLCSLPPPRSFRVKYKALLASSSLFTLIYCSFFSSPLDLPGLWASQFPDHFCWHRLSACNLHLLRSVNDLVPDWTTFYQALGHNEDILPFCKDTGYIKKDNCIFYSRELFFKYIYIVLVLGFWIPSTPRFMNDLSDILLLGFLTV